MKPGAADARTDLGGLLAGLAAYAWWGFSALYWRLLQPVQPLDIIAHRALWALPFCALVLLALGRLRPALAVLRQPRQALLLAASASVIAANWWLFIWSVGAHRLTEASLGYFIQPLVVVVIGMALFGERPARAHWIALGFVAAGIAVYASALRSPPWLALALSVSFGFYGALRKFVSVGSLDGLFIETLLLAPLALGWVLLHDGAGFGAHGAGTDTLLVLSGAFTALPLIAFVTAARKLSLLTMGLVFYLNPSCQLLVAVCWMGEPVGAGTAWGFALVWTGVLFYLAQMLRLRRRLAASA